MTELQREFSKWTLIKRLWTTEFCGDKPTAADRALFYPIIGEILAGMSHEQIYQVLKAFWACEDLPAKDRAKIVQLMNIRGRDSNGR